MTLTNDIGSISTSKTEGFHFPLELGPEQIRRKHFDLRALDFFLSMVKKRKRGRVVAVQAGGNVGVWPHILSKEYDLVITFEPEWHCFACLAVNCQQYNVIKMNAALGDRPGAVRVFSKSISSHKVQPVGDIKQKDGPLTVQITVDSLGLPRCDALLLDVEGYEYRALLGAAKTIAKFRPLVLIEERKRVAKAGANEPLPGKFLEDNGYSKIYHIAGDGIYMPGAKGC